MAHEDETPELGQENEQGEILKSEEQPLSDLVVEIDVIEETYPEWKKEDEALEENKEEDVVDEAFVTDIVLRAAVTADGSTVQLRAGYQFKHPGLFIFLGKQKVTSDDLTHKDALRILRNHPKWFRQNVRRGYYQLNDAYWS